MKCPFCGQEIPNGSKFCSFCGANLEVSDVSNQFKESTAESAYSGANPGSISETLTPENFRDVPTYKSNLMKMIILSGIGLVFAGLGLLFSILYRFVDDSPANLILMIFGLLIGLTFFIVAMTYNKKTFPTTQMIKMKGIEFFVPFFIAFTLVFLIMAIGVQGFYLIIY